MILEINKQVIDDAEELLESGELPQWLARNTTGPLVIAFILDACYKAIDKARAEFGAND